MSDFEIKTNSSTQFEGMATVRHGEHLRTASRTGHWRYVITALISSNAINDTALVALTGGHYDAPHGEPDPSGLAHAFSCMFVGINADDYSDGTHTVQAKRMVRKHGDHYDVWNIEVAFTVDSTLFFDAITKLKATVTAVHQHSKPGPQKKQPPIVDEKGLSESDVENIRQKLTEWEKTHQSDK